MARPLEGLLVADFSRVLAGPLITMTLADLGARVIKVERPGTGDDTRSWGPPYATSGQATYFESVNRNKESVTLDLRDAEDNRLALELATRADVVVENFITGGLDRLGLGYEAVRAVNPDVVFVSVTGFGSAGGAALPGYDFIVQAIGGLMHITGEDDGRPMKAGVALVDVLTAKDGTIGTLAALTRRDRTGEGAHVEVNLLSSLQGALANQIQAVVGAGAEPRRLGNDHPSIVPYQTLACRDAEIAVAIGNDGQFRSLVTLLGAPELADDPRFATNPQRVAHREEVREALESRLADGDAAEWAERIRASGCPVGVVGSIADGLDYAERLGLDPVLELHGPDGAPRGHGVRHPVSYTPSFEPRTQAPPLLGEHDAEVRSWLASSVDAEAPEEYPPV
ncbi:CoA transferase [Pseudoclavibacter chungangensis]|uniref:CoA transferase n=1 Tax=Pseudoclavibacter chungangensis TaxID=587635 RepID=A0A7J5C3F4_9MICO|nr:CaiB/BaiF CoA-transferase family protein [Pseudoclavibacter chungangensis]KAB1662298.1 CoA transferase [Pseudoclavibacter chungangensis]NYJ65505.1 crotonobetainyl-CoA:carnitine CoA-transferase CaiB-like acyl-CoA transferase [Pseudoclavibacter chungangensis]